MYKIKFKFIIKTFVTYYFGMSYYTGILINGTDVLLNQIIQYLEEILLKNNIVDLEFIEIY